MFRSSFLLAILLAMYVYLFTDHVTRWAWYYVPGTLMLAILCAELTDYLAARLVRHRKAFIVSACTTAMLLGYGNLPEPTIDEAVGALRAAVRESAAASGS